MMGLYIPPKEIKVLCTYIPCGYVGTATIAFDRILPYQEAFDRCPECNAFTLQEDDEKMNKLVKDVIANLKDKP